MSEMIIKIKDNGEVAVEEMIGSIKSYKRIEPDDLIQCISFSMMCGLSTGLLPKGCLAYKQNDSGDKGICLLFQESRADIRYYETDYPNFPLPRLVFGFQVSAEGRVFGCNLGIVSNDEVLKPSTVMYRYPFSNVNGFHLCTGNNTLPKCQSLHTLGSLPYFILSMPNNNDHFSPNNNKQGFEMRDLMELMKDKEPEYYYSDILVPFENVTLDDFINNRSV